MTMLRANSPHLYKKGTTVIQPSPKKKRKRKKPAGKKAR
jgi:hypothetical protein